MVLDPRVAAAYLEGFRIAAKVAATAGLEPRDLLRALTDAHDRDPELAARLQQIWDQRAPAVDPWATQSVAPQRRQGD